MSESGYFASGGKIVFFPLFGLGFELGLGVGLGLGLEFGLAWGLGLIWHLRQNSR